MALARNQPYGYDHLSCIAQGDPAVMALKTADMTDLRAIAEDDPVVSEWVEFSKALERSPEDLLSEGIKSIVRNRQTGRLSDDEATTLLRLIASALVERRVNAAMHQYVMPSVTSGRSHPWRALRHFRRSLQPQRGSNLTP